MFNNDNCGYLNLMTFHGVYCHFIFMYAVASPEKFMEGNKEGEERKRE